MPAPNPFETGQKQRPALPMYPPAPQFGKFGEAGPQLGFSSRTDLSQVPEGKYWENVPLEGKQKDTDRVIREAMVERLQKLPFDKLESIARALLKQQPGGKKRKEAMDKFIVDKAKTPVIIDLIVDALGLVQISDPT